MTMAPTPESVESLKHAPGVAGMVEHILHRWSPRSYADRDVPTEDLKKGFEAARWAASSYNEQPWRFLVGHRGDATYKKIFDSLVQFNQDWVKSAPVLILSVARKHFAHNGQINRHSWHDTGAAMANFVLQITALGLHAHSMAGFDHQKAKAAFHIPDDFETVAVTAVGYLGDPESLPEEMRKSEVAPRQRKDLKEFVFSEWEKPAF
jgi:nitroreductase